MNKFFVYIILLLTFYSNAQESKSSSVVVDTSSIVFKAKLMTIERKGIFSEKKLDGFLKDLKHKIYITKDFCFIVVNSADYVIKNNNEKIALFGDCKYYLAYSFYNNLYYRLGGFEHENIDEFSSSFLKSSILFSYNDNVLDEKLVDFLSLVASHKNRKAKKFFPNCKEVMKDEIRLE
ncbi:hypothetical protein [Flavobacterium terrigena]|uniref:Uncharacterized protein n=1 Tax=Flavobacterium terrigena TaxID=402734 RepID=A0A1H6W6M9_9FLAO|nr:hypothetical protein [Flavobacterium terrigena]SEJ08172.1 hypothetical protein SAMN05660918_2306 [Flavobacterium terrigena]